MNSASGELSVGADVVGSPTLAAAQQGQGVAALLVMLAVLCFIFAYCCWGAPFCRSFCRKHCCCRLEDPEPDPRFGSSEQTMVATPTIILLPHGRMLVVDGTIFTQFQADTTGLDLVELGESVIRAHRNPRIANRHQIQNSQGSIIEMDAETPSKDSLGSIGCFPPPTYESIYGKEESDMPPSYSDILLHRFADLPYEMDVHNYCCNGKEEIEMQSLENCSRIIHNPLNALHPYATITSLSSQSFPRRNLSRNSSIISNPLDGYYVDNELEMCRLRQEIASRRGSQSNNENRERADNNVGTRDSENSRGSQPENIRRTAEEARASNRSESVIRSAASENEIMNSRNHDRCSPRNNQENGRNYDNFYRMREQAVVYDRESNYVEIIHGNREIRYDRNARNNEDESVRDGRIDRADENQSTSLEYLHAPRDSPPSDAAASSRTTEMDNTYPEDDADNFGVLADIRESRV